VTLDQFIKIKHIEQKQQNDKGYFYHVLGENSLILERGKKLNEKYGNHFTYDRVAPNNFNQFFKTYDENWSFDN